MGALCQHRGSQGSRPADRADAPGPPSATAATALLQKGVCPAGQTDDRVGLPTEATSLIPPRPPRRPSREPNRPRAPPSSPTPTQPCYLKVPQQGTAGGGGGPGGCMGRPAARRSLSQAAAEVSPVRGRRRLSGPAGPFRCGWGGKDSRQSPFTGGSPSLRWKDRGQQQQRQQEAARTAFSSRGPSSHSGLRLPSVGYQHGQW